jgi:hypothetical protein
MVKVPVIDLIDVKILDIDWVKVKDWDKEFILVEIEDIDEVIEKDWDMELSMNLVLEEIEVKVK